MFNANTSYVPRDAPERMMARLDIAGGVISAVAGSEVFSGGVVLGPTEFILFLTHPLKSGEEGKYVPLILPFGGAGAAVDEFELAGDYLWFLLTGDATPAGVSVLLQRA